MWRLLLFIVTVVVAAAAMAWVADKPGTLTLTWLGYEIETSILIAGLAISVLTLILLLAWSFARYLLSRPAVWGEHKKRNRERRGLDALSRGLVAVGAGDKDAARKYSAQAEKFIPREPLTGLLLSQSAQLHGDRASARAIFQAMAEAPETEMLGLRGLFLEASRENESEAARQFAERAMSRNPDLGWSVNALFEIQCKAGDWAGALRTLDVAQRQKQIEKPVAIRRRAILLTAQAMEAEESDMNRARQLALEAHKLAPELVPAAEIAGRVMASQGDATRAARVITKTWEISPHPGLALAYAHARPGDGPRERLKRVQNLAQMVEGNIEGAIAVATAAVEARAWDEAREALEPYVQNMPPARVCTLMARIEGGETGDQGRVREWLARAVHAPRDPAWTADGYIADQWLPVSPITGALDAFEWKAPMMALDTSHDPLVIEEADPAPAQIAEAEVEIIDGPAKVADGDGAEKPNEDAKPGTGDSSDGMEAEVFVPQRPPDDPGPEREGSADETGTGGSVTR
ncbi:MAG: heme biosynthesis protein HemY [Alphaproteobacteria bacterium]